MDDLDANAADRLASIARQLSSLAPGAGAVVGELMTVIIPRQRLDRVIDYVRVLQHQIDVLGTRVDVFERNAKTDYGSAIIEDSLIQSSRIVRPESRKHVATLVAHSMSEKELDYERTKKLLNLYSELTYPEVITLIYRSLHPTLGEGPHSAFYEQHEAILAPVSNRLGSDQATSDKHALQQSYINMLNRLGLAAEMEASGKRSERITALGQLLVRYIKVEADN